jgi:hypothetical protein
MEAIIKLAKGQRVVWDSGFGYDLCLFVEESTTQYHSYKVDMVTGNLKGQNNTFSKDRVKPYTKELIQKLSQKYGYTLTF